MATIKNFEDLECWKKARELAGYIYQLTNKEKFSRDFALRNQIQEAAGSVMHNISEGFESGYDRNSSGSSKWPAGPALKFNRNCTWRSMQVTSRKMSAKRRMNWQLDPKK